MVELESEPPAPLLISASTLVIVCPKIAKSYKCTPVLGLGAQVPKNPEIQILISKYFSFFIFILYRNHIHATQSTMAQHHEWLLDSL